MSGGEIVRVWSEAETVALKLGFCQRVKLHVALSGPVWLDNR